MIYQGIWRKLVLVTFLGLIAPARAQVTYRAGVAVEDITPCTAGLGGLQCTNGIPVATNDAGVNVSFLLGTGGSTVPLQSVESPLKVSALALGDSLSNRFVIVTIDATILDASFARDIRAKLLQTEGLQPWQVMLNVSHTH